MQGTDTTREPNQTEPQPNRQDLYDIIIIGSGNGACGFLSRYLDSIESSTSPPRILVLEEGESFFQTSDITHQNNWTQAYAEANIFKLHNALTPTGKPIISGRACTMGGGGSINYTMLHESSQWLSKKIGHSPDYWDQLKFDLNEKFHRTDPTKEVSPMTQWILNTAKQFGYQQNHDYTEHIPNFRIGQTGLLHVFPTQFNRFGQRTNSGVSLVDWVNDAAEIKTRHHVERLEFVTAQEGDMSCVGVHVQDLDRGTSNYFKLKPDGGKLILCAGAGSPKLLWPHRETLGRGKVGQHVNDHVLLPLGIYVVPSEIDITGKDVYIPIFATNLWDPSPARPGPETVFNLDFFSGNFERLWFIVAHLYLAFLLPNWLKKIVIRTPRLFALMSNIIRLLLEFINILINWGWGFSRVMEGKSWNVEDYNLVTAIAKFNPAIEGYYSGDDGELITLNFFSEIENSQFNQDKQIAKDEISSHLKLLNELGAQPHWLVKIIFRFLTKIPYEISQVDRYVETNSRRFLLSEQHLAGGCLFSKAIDPGVDDAQKAGIVYGSTNVHVADLSAMPLPRISPQMTAYLVGFYVADRLCCKGKNAGT